MSKFKEMLGMAAKPASKDNLQDIQNEFNQLMFKLGDLSYKHIIINKALQENKSEQNTVTQKMDQLGKDAQKVRERIQEEMSKVASEGKSNEEAPKA